MLVVNNGAIGYGNDCFATQTMAARFHSEVRVREYENRRVLLTIETHLAHTKPRK